MMTSESTKPPPPRVVDETMFSLRKFRGQLQAMQRALEQSMDAPGGLGWESQISEPEPPELTEARARTPPEEERERKWREEFRRNWPDPPKPK